MAWIPIASALASSAINSMGQRQANEANISNSAEARDWQREMRDTTYQSKVKDMQAAGLNPMADFGGGNATPGAPNVPQIKSTTENSASAALAAIQAANVQADTKNKEAQAGQIEAQTKLLENQSENTVSSTGQIKQQTEVLKETIGKIKAEIDDLRESKNLKFNQALSESDRRNLMQSQSKLADIDHRLRAGQINNVEAMTETQKVITNLKKLEIPGMENTSTWEKNMGMIERTTNYGGKVIDTINPLNKILPRAAKPGAK